MPGPALALLLLLFWLAFALFTRWLLAPGIRAGDPGANAALRVFQVYSRLFHRLRVEGIENIPRRAPDFEAGKPLIVVSNHTAGVDPVLIQAALPFEIRWLMGADMRIPAADHFWKFGRVIFVDRTNREARGLRDALRHLHAGGVLGVFPEGHIERPPRHILPFQGGIGLLIAKSKAAVLPVVVAGTPQVDPAWASLWRPSRARLRILPVIDYAGACLDPQAITEDLRRRYLETTGWLPNDRRPRRRDTGEWEYAEAGSATATTH